MRETQVLLAHNIGRMIKHQWFVKGKVKVVKTSAEEILKNHGHEVIKVNEFLNPPKKKEKFDINGLYDRELEMDENHPDYKKKPCLIYKDNNVPIKGLEQAKVLTNTVEISEGLPDSVSEIEKKLILPEEIHSEVIKKVKLCCMFEATQMVLPRRKDPLRPAWVFPRDYGIVNSKKNELLCKNLAIICEQHAENLSKNKSLISNGFFSTSFEAHNNLIQFEVTSELIVTTGKMIGKFAEPSSANELHLPDIYPIHSTVGLNPFHFYVLQNRYPLNIQSKWPYVQTAFTHFDETSVKNVTGEKVSESQIQARSLLKGFTIAAAQARAVFGSDVKQLPKPVAVPVVQTDGRMFHFTIFQLNTLDLEGNSGEKNILWNSARVPLYLSCMYERGRPLLKDYNEQVIRRLIAFYNIE